MVNKNKFNNSISIKNFVLNPMDNNINFKEKICITTILVICSLTLLSSIMNFQYNIREFFIDTFTWEFIFNIFKISISTIIIYMFFDDETRNKEGIKGALQYVLIASLCRIAILFVGAILSIISVKFVSIISMLGLVAFILNLYIILTLRGNFTSNKGVLLACIMVLFM